MSYLQCPECRLTVPSAAYYLRGDECPRCLATMEKRSTFRSDAALTAPAPLTVPPPSSQAAAQR